MYRRRQWVAFDKKKRPIDPNTGRAASPTDATTWGTYAEACAMVDVARAAGIGFVLTASDPYVCIDLDKCRDPETGDIEPWALEIVEAIGSYTEVSPSGTGLHIWMLATMPGDRNRIGRFEVYGDGRYMTVTGQSLPGYASPVRPSQEPFNALYARLFPAKPTEPRPERPAWTGPGMESETIIRKASTARNGAKFRALYAGDTSDYGSDDSRADAAFVGMLAFWTQDPEQITEIWRSSGLYRAKTDREDYARRTVARILDTYAGPVYTPEYRSTPTAPIEPEPIEDDYDELTHDELLAIARRQRATLHGIRCILASDDFQAGPRVSAIGALLEIDDQRARGVQPTEDGYKVTAARVAQRTGLAPKTVSGHLKELHGKGAIVRNVVTKIVDMEGVDTETGEIVPIGKPLKIGYIKADNVISFAERVASYKRTPHDAKHGGDRPSCKNHPDAGTITYSTVVCAECHEPIIENVTHQRPKKRTTQDGHSGIRADSPQVSMPERPARTTQDGHTESVSICMPKMGSPESAAPLWDAPSAPADDTPASNPCSVCHAEMPPDRHYQCAACSEKYQRLNSEQGRLSA